MRPVATEAAELAACRGVSVTLGDFLKRSILSEIDVSVAEGEALALWGPSGSGKTTLLHLLGGLLVPSSGEVLWRGRPLSSLDVAARARARAGGIAYVFQASNLLPTFTAYENVAFTAWVAERAGGERGQDPAELLELVGLARKLEALPAELSGGESQRVAIARALAQRPRIMLCDEPTGHLDSDTAERVLDLIDALRERLGFAVVLATHDRLVAGRYPRLVRMRDGRVEEDRPA